MEQTKWADRNEEWWRWGARENTQNDGNEANAAELMQFWNELVVPRANAKCKWSVPSRIYRKQNSKICSNRPEINLALVLLSSPFSFLFVVSNQCNAMITIAFCLFGWCMNRKSLMRCQLLFLLLATQRNLLGKMMKTMTVIMAEIWK